MSLRDMSESDLEDLFFNTEDFAIAGTYTPKGGNGYTINGLFDREYKDVNPGGEIAVMSNVPVFRVAEKSMQADPGSGDTITISGTTYHVKEAQPDGSGIIDLYLMKA